MPSLKALQVFHYVAQTLSMKQAASQLGVTATAVSHQIKTLEESLGIALFVRKTRSLELTQKGSILKVGISKAFSEIQSCIDNTVEDTNSRFTIMASPLFVSKWLLPKIGKFKHEFPTSKFRLVTSPTVNLHTAKTDIVFRYDNQETNNPSYDKRELFDVSLLPVCSPEYYEAHPVKTLAELQYLTLLHDEETELNHWLPGWDVFFEHCGLDTELIPDGSVFSNSHMVIESAIAGHGWAMGIDHFLSSDIQKGNLIAPLPERLIDEGKYVMHIKKTSINNRHICDFVDWVNHMMLVAL